MFDNDASVVAGLHAQGRKVICYVDVGTWESYRPDAASFPDSVKGNPVDGFSDERWLDIRQLSILGPIMQARLDLCKQKGFDAVEPDNVDGYTNNPGFPFTAADQATYNLFIAQQAHARGLSVGLKNDLDQIPQLIGSFDWTLNEQCFEYEECGALTAFVQAGKSVLQVEYNLQTSQFCSTANSMNFNSMLKDINLDAYRVACRVVTPAAPAGPAITAVANSASYAANGVSPNEIVVIFGSAIGPSAITTAPSIAWPQTLGGTQVLFDGAPAQLLYVSASQISAVVPASVQGQSTTKITVNLGNGSVSQAVTVPVVAAVPALFTLNAQGTGGAAISNQDGTVNGTSNPAKIGAYISLYATGVVATDVQVSIGGANAAVTYSGGVSWSGPGLVQINAIVPAASTWGPAVPVTIQSAGVSSPNGVTLAITP
jgi:uncharacterized protein (TIGR03437 family)